VPSVCNLLSATLGGVRVKFKVLLSAAVAVALLLSTGIAEAALSLYTAQRAATRYVNRHCEDAPCQVRGCRTLSASRIDCTAYYLEAGAVSRDCEYTVHVSQAGKYEEPAVWKGRTYCA
jgi:hypothetical protein